jgi:hypothetical protein
MRTGSADGDPEELVEQVLRANQRSEAQADKSKHGKEL